MRVGILQTGHVAADLAADHGSYHDMFRSLLADFGLEFAVWNVVDGDFPASLADADGWLLTGSRHGVYEDHPWIAPLAGLIGDAVAYEQPVVGICFGHQMIAKALGGKVEKHAGGWIIGAAEYDFAATDGESSSSGSGTRTMCLNAWHQDQVIELPAGARAIATGRDCANAVLAYDGTAFSMQAHPEFDHSFISGLIKSRGPGVVPEPLLAAARQRLGTPTDSRAAAWMISTFLHDRCLE